MPLSNLLARIDALMRRRSPVAVKTRLEVGDLELDLLTRAAKRGEQAISNCSRANSACWNI